MPISDISVSTVYILVTLVAAELTRLAYKHFLEPNGLILNCALEFISAFELCAVCYECGMILELYGVWAYAAYLFAASIWWNYRWSVSACPYILVELWLGGNVDATSALAQIAAEIAGASIFYSYYLKHLWALEYGTAHRASISQQQCFSDIKVAVWAAACVEGGAVFASRLFARALAYYANLNDHSSKVINTFVGTVLILFALNSSGGYYNPVLASALQYGCQGATMWEHLAVYWLSPIIAAILVVLIWKS